MWLNDWKGLPRLLCMGKKREIDDKELFRSEYQPEQAKINKEVLQKLARISTNDGLLMKQN